MISGLLFLPAELVAETGIGIREPCGVMLKDSTNGVCASNNFSGSLLGIAAHSLLVQRVKWIDNDWDVLFEGSSRNMQPEEVHVVSSAYTNHDKVPTKLASSCTSTVESCPENGCGTITIGAGNGAMGRLVANASLLKSPEPRLHWLNGQTSEIGSNRSDSLGLTANVGKSMVAILFQRGRGHGLLPHSRNSSVSDEMDAEEIQSHGVETILSPEQIDAIRKTKTESITLHPDPEQTRQYRVSCQAVGMSSSLFAKALAIYRGVQIENPIITRTSQLLDISAVEPMNCTDVLKAIFAVRSEDKIPTCSRLFPIYVPCGTYKWRPALFILLITAAVFIVFLVMHWLARGLNIHAPHDSDTWRSFALESVTERSIRAEVRSISNRKQVVLISEDDAQQYHGERCSPDALQHCYSSECNCKTHSSFSNV